MNNQNCPFKENAFDEYTTPWQGFYCTCPDEGGQEFKNHCPYFNDWSVGRCPHLFPSMKEYTTYVLEHLHDKGDTNIK